MQGKTKQELLGEGWRTRSGFLGGRLLQLAGLDGGAHWAAEGELFERRDELVRVHACAHVTGVVIVFFDQ